MALISPEASQCVSADLAEEQDGFRLVWWNTSRNPPRTKGVSAKDPVSVYVGLNRLLEVTDMVFLGETLISREIVDTVNKFNRKHSSFVDKWEFVIDYRRGDAENSKFYTLCLYNASSFKTDKALKRMGLPPLAQEYVYILSANVPQYDEALPIFAYQVDPTRCYLCVIQNGSQNYLCTDLLSFEDGLNWALADNSLKVTMALNKIAEKHKVDPVCMVS